MPTVKKAATKKATAKKTATKKPATKKLAMKQPAVKTQGGGTKEILAQLEACGEKKVRARNKKLGAGEKQFGVPMGAIRKIADKIKTNHELALALWKTENLEARLLAILILVPKNLASSELDRMVRDARFAQLADWLSAYVVKNHPEKETLRQAWMQDDDSWAARAGWSLTSGRINSSPDGLDLVALLDRIESEMGDAAAETQWTMNTCLGGIGIQFPKHRKRAIGIGEKIGLYRDWPVSKGCTPPFVPTWVNEMVRRKGG